MKALKKKAKQTGSKCPVCKTGDVVEKMSKYGKFYSCSDYPTCKQILIKNDDGTFSTKSVKEKVFGSSPCPLCHGKMVERSSTYGKFFGCVDYPKCRGMRKADGTPAETKKKRWRKKK